MTQRKHPRVLRMIGATVVLGSAVILQGFSAHTQEREDPLQFPDGFKWCVATAAHQVEGNNVHSDWWAFEQTPGAIKNGDKSGAADDHWNLIDLDVALMKKLNLTEYRFSVEWAKIEPAQGRIDREAVRHYARLVRLLEANGIQPLITLHHFTFPNWVREKGGWEWDGVVAAFDKFTRLVYTDIGPSVRDWVTINEPMPHLSGGYLAGLVPPAVKGYLENIVGPLKGLLKGHAAAYHALHDLAQKSGKTVRVGIAHHLRTFDARFALNPIDHIVVAAADQTWNWMIPDAIETGHLKMSAFFKTFIDEDIAGLKGTQDYFGLNYYTGDLVSWSLTEGLIRANRSWTERNDMGWDIYPEGFYRVLTATHERYPRHNIVITENGIADAKDEKRKKYLQDHLAVVAQVIKENINVEGYCHWSLMDNFEWDNGFEPRFGLYAVDYKTQTRTLRESGKWFAEIAGRNAPRELKLRAPASVQSQR